MALLTFGASYLILRGGGAVLCIVGCLAASLASTLCVPGAGPLSQPRPSKMSPDFTKGLIGSDTTSD